MSKNNIPQGFVFFSKDEIDQQYDRVVKDCHKVDSYVEAKELLHKGFYNKMFMAQKYGEEMGTTKVYRVTTEYPGFDPLKTSCFSYPPKPKRGRANIEGSPVFYCSFNPTISLLEMKDSLSPDQLYYVSEWEIVYKKVALCHPLLYNSTTNSHDFHTANLAKEMMDRFMSNKVLDELTAENKVSLKHLLTRLGDLFTLPTVDYYNITSAYAHNLLYELKEQGLDISMLMYPSVVSEHKGVNLAIHPTFVDSMMSLKSVSRLRVTSYSEDAVGCSIISVGLPVDDGTIEWYYPTVDPIEIAYDDIEVFTDNGLCIIGEEALTLQVNNTLTTVRDIFHEAFDNNKKLIPRPNLGTILSPLPLVDKTNDIKFTQTFRKGLVIETKEGLCNIEKIDALVRYTDTHRKYLHESFTLVD
jgi:hypothetical protein